MRYSNYKIGAPVLAMLCFLLAMAWPKHREPFERLDFSLKNPSGEKVDGIVFLPKPIASYAVVIYAHARGEDLMTMDTTLRQFAELGMAAVGFEYDPTNQAGFNEQFLALQAYIKQQSWAQNNAIAWVGFSQGAQMTLSFILMHPESQPQLLVGLSGGGVPEIYYYSNSIALIKCPVLLVHGEDDGIFPVENAKRLADLLRTNSVSVNVQIISGHNHSFGQDDAVVMRATAEYCRAHLPLTDYTVTLDGCQLNNAERERFNLAMQRAGEHRRELWEAVASSREPERRTVMMVIGGMEDYDLAHVMASDLKENVHLAWQARRTYPWCRGMPLDIFEKYVAGPRFFQEPIEDWRCKLNRLVRHEVKYCLTTQEASDRVWELMNEKVAFTLQETGGGNDPLKILEVGDGSCFTLCIVHAAMARSVGLAERVTRVLWQNSLGEHYCVEIWSAQDRKWHEIDVSAGDRSFNNNWVIRVPKTAILAPTGDRGLWDGPPVGRWSSFTNTIGLVYPSGDVLIKVLDHGVPAPDRTVGIKLPSVKGLVAMALARTDLNGEVRVTLGRSAKYPYLFYVLPPDEAAASAKYPFPFLHHDFGDETWQWVTVQSGRDQEVVLDLENRRPFNPNLSAPTVPKPI